MLDNFPQCLTRQAASAGAQVVANPFLWAKLQDSVRRTLMFAEFATSTPAAASPVPVRDAAEPPRQRRLTGFARQQLVASKAAAVGAAPAAQHAAQDLVQAIQTIAATVLGSAVAAKASFSDAGLDSLGEQPVAKRYVQGVQLHLSAAAR